MRNYHDRIRRDEQPTRVVGRRPNRSEYDTMMDYKRAMRKWQFIQSMSECETVMDLTVLLMDMVDKDMLVLQEQPPERLRFDYSARENPCSEIHLPNRFEQLHYDCEDMS